MTRLFLVSATLLVVAVSAISFLFLERSVERELDALTEGRIKEYRVEFEKAVRSLRDAPPAGGTEEAAAAPAAIVVDNAKLEEIARDVSRRQPLPLAWRVWEGNWGRVVVEFGPTELLAESYPLLEPLNETVRPAQGLRWRTEPLSHGLTVGLVLDGAQQIAVLRSFQTFATGLLVLAVLVSLALGAYMILRVSRMLRRIAAGARAARDPTAEEVDIEVADAPEEIRDVLDALHQLYANIRSESEKSRVFYASMAHELRSPIQNLVGETEVALFAHRADEEYRKVLESNLEELRDLGDAIDNLVTICAHRRPFAVREQEEFNLLDEARIRLSRERTQAQRYGVELRLEGSGPLSMRGDREGLLRALRNLAANAIQWSPPGSAVEVNLSGQNGRIEITVDDAGPGVPEELREQVFVPFFRGPVAAGQRVGYGLGLAIVRSAVDAHGGKIQIERAPGGGARFHLVLPRDAQPAGADGGVQAGPPAR